MVHFTCLCNKYISPARICTPLTVSHSLHTLTNYAKDVIYKPIHTDRNKQTNIYTIRSHLIIAAITAVSQRSIFDLTTPTLMTTYSGPSVKYLVSRVVSKASTSTPSEASLLLWMRSLAYVVIVTAFASVKPTNQLRSEFATTGTGAHHWASSSPTGPRTYRGLSLDSTLGHWPGRRCWRNHQTGSA